MLASARLRSTFGRRDLGDPYWANVSLLLQPPNLAGGTNRTFVDSSTNNFTVSRFGDVVQTGDSPVVGGGSAYFDGGGDFLTVPGNTSLAFGTGDFTIELWFKLNDTYGGRMFADFRPHGTNGPYPLFAWNGSSLVWHPNATGAISISAAEGGVMAGSWYHVAVARSGTSTKMFLNGIQVGSFTDTINYGCGTNRPIISGNGYTSGTINSILGNVSDFRIVKGTALYTANFTPPTAPLEAVSGTSLLLNMRGKIFDKSPQSNTVSVVGDAQTSTATPLDGMGSVDFDGTGDYLKIPTDGEFNFATGDFTVEMWIKPDAAPVSPGYQYVVSEGSGGLFVGVNAFTSPFGLGFGRSGVAWDYVSGVMPTVGQWSHLALSRSGTDMRMFLNGTQIGTTQTNSTSWNLAVTSMLIGFDGSKYFNGQMADLRITKGVGRYTQAFTPPTRPLPAQ